MPRNETVYGESVLAGELGRLGSYLLVTDEAPYGLCRDRLGAEPERILMPGTLEKSALDEMARDLPEEAEVVGLGGGSVMDAAKYFAFLLDRKPLLVPTITSSNAQFSDFISVRREGRPFGFKQDGWPRRIVVDYDLIGLAEPRLNRAGFGDLLFLQTALEDWRISNRAGRGEPVDPEVERAVEGLVDETILIAGEVGAVSRRGIEALMRLFEQSTELTASNPSAPIGAGSEHLFAWNLEGVTGRHFIHGEVVALGTVICSYLQRSAHAELVGALREARVVFEPSRTGVSWEEIEETLLTVQEYNRQVRHFHTVFDEVDWTEALLREVREMLSELEGER
jgi:glycerol-1-phosphate dehydrogenase [NAD(P)+]